MAVNGVSGLSITGTLSDGKEIMQNSRIQTQQKQFENLLKEMQSKTENQAVSGVSSSQISKNHKLNGDYTQGFYGTFTSEADKTAEPKGLARNAVSKSGKKITIDKTSDLYAQSMEMENYLVKMMLSSMRNTISHTSLLGEDNSYARDMYEDMMYDNLSESLTKNSGFGLADQIYIELSQKM